MDKTLQILGSSRPFELPSHFDIWITCDQTFAHLHTFKAHLGCDGLKRTLESKAFNPRNPEDSARAWLEFMSLTGNIIITSVMPPDMISRFQPVSCGGMRLMGSQEEDEA